MPPLARMDRGVSMPNMLEPKQVSPHRFCVDEKPVILTLTCDQYKINTPAPKTPNVPVMYATSLLLFQEE